MKHNEKLHKCENYRFTAEKYLLKDQINFDENEEVDFNKMVLVSWCSKCGKLLRKVFADPQNKKS